VLSCGATARVTDLQKTESFTVIAHASGNGQMKFHSKAPMFCLVLAVLCLAGCETKTADQKLVGKWQLDDFSEDYDMKMEFAPDGVLRLFFETPEISDELQLEWVVIKIEEETVTIEILNKGQSSAFQEVVFLDDDTLELTGLGTVFNNIELPGPKLRFKRVE
jgi:hypothetical protein